MSHVSLSLSNRAATAPSFPVIHSILDPAALPGEVLSLYDLDRRAKCLFLARGVNDTYLVQTPAEHYILRAYRTGWRTLSDILYEVDVLNHLGRTGIPVSLPLAQRDRTFVHTLLAPEGPRHLVLFTYAPGAPPNRHDATDSYSHGKALAALHNATDGFSSDYARGALDLDYLISQSLQAIQSLHSSSAADWDYLQALSARLRLQIQQLSIQGLDWGVCHGDCHMLNEHVSEDRTIIFFDFDCCAAGWRAYDLAIVRWSEGFYHMDPDDVFWQAFLKGYREQRPLAEANLASIPAFVAIREIWHTALIARLQPSSGLQGCDRMFQRTLRLLRAWETTRLKQ